MVQNQIYLFSSRTESLIYTKYVILDEEITYFNWSPEQAELRAEQCVVMDPNNDYRWRPENCDEKNYFFCQESEFY